MKRAALHNLGCKTNAYETQAMRRMLEEAGYEIVSFDAAADLYVVNTCSVTNTADHKSGQMIRRARRKNPDAVVVAAGCHAHSARRDEAADILLGNNEKRNLISVIKAYEAGGKTVAEDSVADISAAALPYEELRADRPAERTRAFLKVQDGCDSFCSYCLIPYVRGRARSRKPNNAAREAREMVKNGFLEIVLTGINLSSYGTDLGCTLLDLIRALHGIDGLRRIRLSSLEPGLITKSFARELCAMEKVCPHFHLSLQSGSDTVLERMGRRYTAEEYLEKCAILRSFYEHPAITTDIIVGFPGETQGEFSESLDLVEKAGFYEVHIFPYSKRDKTKAARMDGQVTRRLRRERSRRLAEAAKKSKKDFIAWYEGREVEVLFERSLTVDGALFWEGFTPEYVRARLRSDECCRNKIKTVEFFGDFV